MTAYYSQLIQLPQGGAALSGETLVPTSDISGTYTDNTGGDGNGDLWDEIDEVPPDDTTTFIDHTNQVGSGERVDEFTVGVEAATEDHETSQDHIITVRSRISETGSLAAQTAAIRKIWLRDSNETLDFDDSDRHLGTSYNDFSTNTLDVTGLSHWSDLRIGLESAITGDSQNFDVSTTAVEVTQAFLEIKSG